MAETMNQQTKLIGFLQDKVESTPQKKKWVKVDYYILFVLNPWSSYGTLPHCGLHI